MEPITDHASLLAALGTRQAVADTLVDCTVHRVGQWRLQNRIPVEYWPGIIEMACGKGLVFVTSDWLMNTVRPRSEYGAKNDSSSTEAA